MTLRILPLLALAIGLLALAGCGGSSSTSSSAASTPLSTPSTSTPSTATKSSTTGTNAPSGALKLEANPEGQLKYSTSSLTAKAGKVSVDFTNMSPLAHNFTVEAAGGKIEGATPTFQGGNKVLTLNLKPGTYKFFCTVPGHRMAGMEGTLTVTK
ncbi:MAG: plastocyanin/azurin family copper-binding protein [Solirubrobacteraceae bacterium]